MLFRAELSSSVPHFAKARLDDLNERLGVGNPDLIVTMMWNTDRTDVDLHILEPSGEECFYKNPNTRAGGRITADVTEGFGPEMYTLDLPDALPIAGSARGRVLVPPGGRSRRRRKQPPGAPGLRGCAGPSQSSSWAWAWRVKWSTPVINVAPLA